MKTTPYIMRVLIAADVFFNVLFDGDIDMTISARLGLHRGRTWWGTLGSDILDKIQNRHVEQAIIHDKERAEQVEDALKEKADSRKSSRELDKRAFFEAIEPVKQHWPTLETTLHHAFYGELTIPDTNGIIMAGLGKQCAETLEEIHLVCMSGYGLAGTKLLRGLYERTATAAFFVKNPEASRRFMDSFDLDFGKLMHRHQEFAKANGQDPNTILPAWALKLIEDEYKRVKGEEESCDKCGAPKGRIDVFSMVQASCTALAPYYGLCFLEPTFHVHCTWYSVLTSVNVRTGENHIDFDPHPEGERALKILQLSHFLILHAIETQNAYFRLSLEEELTQRWADYKTLWEAAA